MATKSEIEQVWQQAGLDLSQRPEDRFREIMNGIYNQAQCYGIKLTPEESDRLIIQVTLAILEARHIKPFNSWRFEKLIKMWIYLNFLPSDA